MRDAAARRAGAPPAPPAEPPPAADPLQSRRHDRRFDLKHRSRALTEGPERAAARAYLKGIGYDDEALRQAARRASPTRGSRRCRATSTCARWRRKVKEGIRAAGGTPMELNTIAISDGITMGTAGMRASLVSREVIADSIELVVRRRTCSTRSSRISGCDKTIPGTVMALCRLDVPER